MKSMIGIRNYADRKMGRSHMEYNYTLYYIHAFTVEREPSSFDTCHCLFFHMMFGMFEANSRSLV